MVAEILRGEWKRARQPEQKLERRQEILTAAAVLFEEGGFDGITLNGVARQAGLAKSNLYRYFESLEEILLHLLLHDLDELIADVENDSSAPGMTLEDVADRVAVALESRTRLTTLLTQMAGVLERNISVEVGKRFKREVAARTARLGLWLARLVPELEKVEPEKPLLTLHAMLSGIWFMANPSPVMVEVMQESDLRSLRVDFRPAFRHAFSCYLRGLLADVDAAGDLRNK